VRIVYNSFGGRFSDNPRVLYDALRRSGDHEHVWLRAAGHEDSFPAGVATVEAGGPECVATLEACDLLVANTHTEVEWEKPPGALYLQTWHGTPLKRIHWDVMWAPEGRLERLSRDVARWDLLLSPNRASTPRLRGAFKLDAGQILETGYPRNDILSAPDRDAIRARVRERLGIADGTRAVLYTPTWRDDFVFDESKPEYALPLDVEHLLDGLGADHCLMLRLHYMLTGRLAALEHPGVRDVSFHPDVAELYLAADVLVTDYSSTMFDFAVTGKPIVFYAYDLEDYRDSLRGFYFDFVPDAPGPVTRTTAELTGAIRDVDGLRGDYAERYARFRDTFCHLEDGHATERVLAAISARRAPGGPGTPAPGPARR
jgi:CDP-glycerol glycerophosphotransferase